MEISPDNLIETLSEIINDLNHNQWNRLLGEAPENWEDDYNYIAIKYKIFDNISKLLNDPFEMLCYYTHCKYIAKAPFCKRELQYYLLDGIYDEYNYQSSLNVVSKLKEWIKKRYNRIKVNKSK